MNYSPITNIAVLHDLKTRGMLPNYLLLLAHEVVEAPHAFANLLADHKAQIILDNSLIELGKPVSEEVILKAAEVVKPDWVVLPDKLNDGDATVKLVAKAVSTWASKMKWGWMLVPQGKNTGEFLECARALAEIGSARDFIWGLPRIHTNNDNRRSMLADMLSGRWDTPIHLLGMSKDFRDDMYCFRNHQVMGIDSATPLRAGWEGVKYNYLGMEREESTLMDRQKYFNTCAYVNHTMAYNIGFVMGQIQAVRTV